MSVDYQFGPLVGPDGVTFRLWSPAAHRVDLVLADVHAMQRGDNGWYRLTVPTVGPSTHYRFRIDGELDVPDPASRYQPQDVDGPSEVIDQTFDWQARDWHGRPWHECVFLELHVGAFSAEGTFNGVIDKLKHVADAGFTAIELMPVADFFGRWNWGYDGVLLFAADSTYGRPHDLKALVDAAHQHGLMVFLDVVYNHFGPEGNYLGRYAPQFFAPANTPWGSAIDYMNGTVRRFAIENALYWLGDFRFDGLRLDAVHAIPEPGRVALLHELSESVGTLAADSGRQIHLVVENDANQAGLLDPITQPPRGKYRAQWNDDYHHAFHVLLTGEKQGYYCDYGEPARHLARALAQGFAYQGEASRHRHGAARGEKTAAVPLTAFVNFLQNHDQVGNRPLGERLVDLTSPAALQAALAMTLLAPSPPLMFMGDEWGAHHPFPFFCDFKGELADAVRNGRRHEFAEAYRRHGDQIPDPLAEETFRQATLDWAGAQKPEHQKRLALVKDLLATRRSFVIPRLPELALGSGCCRMQDGVLLARWNFQTGEALAMLANLGEQSRPSPRDFKPCEPVWGGMPAAELPPWSVHVAIERV
jgi:maltooligosyltrehalose trehalohydrolase